MVVGEPTLCKTCKVTTGHRREVYLHEVADTRRDASQLGHLVSQVQQAREAVYERQRSEGRIGNALSCGAATAALQIACDVHPSLAAPETRRSIVFIITAYYSGGSTRLPQRTVQHGQSDAAVIEQCACIPQGVRAHGQQPADVNDEPHVAEHSRKREL